MSLDRIDIRADVHYLPTNMGGRRTPAREGYRPNHRMPIEPEPYHTTGTHHYVDCDSVEPGSSAITEIQFISPQHYRHCLTVGSCIKVQEGGRIVGWARILEILNPDLLKSDGV